MKCLLAVILTFFLVIGLFSQDDPAIRTDIDILVQKALSDYGIPGASLAIVKEGKVIHREEYGFANLEHEVPVKKESIFRLYSITKIFVATAVFQLIEAGKLSLEDDLSEFDLRLPLSWQNRKIKHLLTHSSGFPDMSPIPDFQDLSEVEARKKVFGKALNFEAGSSYSYNQTNFYLLQKVVEEASGQYFNDFILNNQFASGGEDVFFSMDSREVITNRVTAYFPFATGKRTIEHPYLMGNYFAACNGMNITMDAFLLWDEKLRNGEILKENSKAKMFNEFSYSNSSKRFAYAWDKRVLNGHNSFGFSGSMVTAYRVFPDDDLSIILLGNGMSKFFDIEDIINDIAHLVKADIKDLEREYNSKLFEAANQSGFEAYRSLILEFKAREGNEDIEGISNSIGYQIMNGGNLKLAMQIFELNVSLFPESWNVYDSLGEAYLSAGRKSEAIANYKKSIALNPDNHNGHEVLSSLE